MRPFLLLRFDAPLLSFGGPRVDQEGVSQAFPGLSLLAGLFGNALGYAHGDGTRLNELQGRIRYAVRCDRRPREIVDYQTVDLGQPSLVETGWTTRGLREDRAGGSRTGTHIRYQHYLADGVFTLAVILEGDGDPNLEALAEAIKNPERPIFLGRKACLPAAPIFLALLEADDLLSALCAAPLVPGGRGETGLIPAWWPEGENSGVADAASRAIRVADIRDWSNQIHTGRRIVRQGRIAVEGVQP